MNNKTIISIALSIGVISSSVGLLDYNSIVSNADVSTTQSLLSAKKYAISLLDGYNDEYDVNGDGSINVLDILQMKRDIIKEGNLTDTSTTTQDVYSTPFSDGAVCTIKNVGSGKYLNVDYGYDEDSTNVYQWTGDGSTEQQFKMDFISDSSCYRIRAMCSSDGNDKTLDIVKSNGNVVSDCNVEIYSPVDQIAQEWLFVSLGDNTYKIVPKYNTNLALTTYGDSNGSADGTTSTSNGNVFVSTDVDTDYQKWVITVISETETTTTTTTTTEPSETLPSKAYISGVTPIVQSGLPTGCEATGLTIALRWYGFDVTKEEIALTYMPRQDFYYADGKKIGADYMTTFAGDPSRKDNSYGCYIPCMIQTVQNYFDDIGVTDYTTIDLSGSSLDDLFEYIADGTPVILIATNDLVTPTEGDSWYTEDGRYITWQKGHHCMVLTGYDYDSNTVTVSESAYSDERTYDMDSLRSIYNQKGKYAMIISKVDDDNQTIDNYVTPFSDGDICTIKNVGSGKYLNVDYGNDVDATNVYQWTGDGSTEQQFKMDFISDSSCYRIRAMCSSDGDDKTLDIVKSSGNVLSGCNVDIYQPIDQIAQEWLFVSLGNNTYKIVPRYNTDLALTVYGNSNGSADGTTDTSAGNVFVSSDVDSSYQKWVITKID
ncbi:MAG: RICIN domain-containing protein [Ruminococcus sp.]|nr:RICIN domain-containing protein [Ruminococcus sp.]